MEKDLFIIIRRIKDFIISSTQINEEETKNYLIYPFFTFLGYDLSSPNEAKYEMSCELYGNGRADCVLLGPNRKPTIVIEAKAFGTYLKDGYPQLKSYFVGSGALYGIITDGNKYHIFEKKPANKSQELFSRFLYFS